ncbi:TolC family protein [Natronogracilivirga saccharolytica]|uniref:TolC family protein n=1 Tax=Natronogracilivirga saccharolytica TaxID=2812953 RepID=A0A8J7RKA6_9BACT|nr:TolC family protein [Natronogracilivirga saccharolytica]MBP3192375.1 TolC family protein [Natronogracilivirga saccharolytica]
MRTILILISLSSFFLFCLAPSQLSARDTVRVTFGEFSEIAKNYSSNLEAQQRNVSLAQNRIKQAQNTRFLPNLNLTTAHGLVPGVKSQDPDLSSGQYYLDPDLENDWEDWGIFTQAEISGIQPIYTWGAIGNAINAAQKGADAAQFEYEAEKESFEIQLFELYQSALLVRELGRLVDDAKSQLREAERELERLQEEGDESIEEKDIFEFRIFQAEFQALISEFTQTRDFVQRSWDLVLAAGPNTVFLPAERFFDPVPVQIQEYDFYKNSALQNRAELKGIDAARQAAQYGVDAARAEYYPSLVLGLSAGFGYTPNRPRQTNPFIRNTTNFLSARVGFGFQQNLNFRQVSTNVERSEIRKRQADDFHDAARDGILLEISDRYREAKIKESQKESKSNALRISNEWLRTEQIDFDIGFGDIQNLVDAVKKQMELELEVAELTFDLNIKIARLHRSAGLSLDDLMPDTSGR